MRFVILALFLGSSAMAQTTAHDETTILDVLAEEKRLADIFTESYRKYNRVSKKWNSPADSTAARNAVEKLETYSETKYSEALVLIPKVFCANGSKQIIASFIKTMWSDRGSASEEPSTAIGECFKCNYRVVADEISKLTNQEQKQLIIDQIDFGLQNIFYVSGKAESDDPQYLDLKKKLMALK